MKNDPIAPQIDWTGNIPADFPRFSFPGHDVQADILSHFLWYHFSSRLCNVMTLFNKEYLTIADLWLAGAQDTQRNKCIQEVLREDLLAIRMDADGYVHTHQHFSHAHEHGWPFPYWAHDIPTPEECAGKVAGWHFQEDGPGWFWNTMRYWGKPAQFVGLPATEGWSLEHVTSLGIDDDKWQLQSTGLSPAITTPAGMEIEAFLAPFLQLRWTRSGEPPNHQRPYIEWLCEGDEAFGEDRRVYFDREHEQNEGITRCTHSMITMYHHPKWRGKITRMRLSLVPGEADIHFAIDSFFTVFDTRHTINNPLFVIASRNYFRWTGDQDFLRANINRMRIAHRFQQTELGGLRYQHIRNPWSGHDGLPGWTKFPDGTKVLHLGHGIGTNYYDLLPFGGDDMYQTSQYYASTLAMAELEESIRANPGWNIPTGPLALDPAELRAHAAAVKQDANQRFWDAAKGRFVGCIDVEGAAHDFGFTFVNLEAIWNGIASDEHARQIMDWISGKRVIEGDTSTGADIYRWRFGPRATTRRNAEWYCHSWDAPTCYAWGEQIQDGGAVLGFTFYDLWSRLQVYGADDAWNRLSEILEWEEEVWQDGGYREYYRDGKQGASLQGGDTAGGIGIDKEFFESSMLPAFIVFGFLGLNPSSTELAIQPRLPSQCPTMRLSNLLYHGVRLHLEVTEKAITIEIYDAPVTPLHIALAGAWTLSGSGVSASSFHLTRQGVYHFCVV